MDLRTRTSLFCGALALAIAVSMLLRRRPRRAQWFFAAFSADIGLWYVAQWLYLVQLSPIWAHFTAVLVVALPQFAVHLFEALVPRTSGGRLLPRVAGLLFFPMLLLVLSPEHTASWVRGAVLAYVFGVLAAALWSLWRRGEGSGSRSTQKRVRFVVACGALATAFSLADFLWFVGVPLRDTQCGFRVFRVDALRGLRLRASGYEIETEMLVKSRRRGARLVSVPITAVYAGERSKLRPVRDTTRTCFLAVYYRFLERV